MKRLYILAIFFVFISTSIINAHKAMAIEGFSMERSVEYVASDSPTMTVIERIKVTNKTNLQYLEGIKIATPVPRPHHISANYDDGEKINHSVSSKDVSSKGIDYSIAVIDLEFPKVIVGLDQSWNFELKYQTEDLIESRGQAKVVYIPAVSGDSQSGQQKVRLTVPDSFGNPHAFGIKPVAEELSDINKKNSSKSYYFNSVDLANNSIGVVFGDSTIYQFTINYPLKNDGLFDTTLTITLPPDSSSQKVYISSLNPQPISTRLDEEGNILAEYRVKKGTSLNVEAKLVALINYIEYDFSKVGTTKDIPSKIFDLYTKPTKYWNSDDVNIKNQAKKIIGNEKSIVKQVQLIQQFSVSHLSYNLEKIKYNIRQGGKAALANPNNAVCLEYSDLTISLLRAIGLPARMPVGYAYSNNLKSSNSVADSLHSWVEVYMPNLGWVNLDPTWAEKFDNFGHSDLDHLTFALWGKNDSLPTAIMDKNIDLNYQYENTTITLTDKVRISDSRANGSYVKKLIFPGISWQKVTVLASSSESADNFFVSFGKLSNKKTTLGSLAPLQEVKISKFIFGKQSWASDTMLLGRTKDKKDVELLKVKSSLDYSGLIAGLGLLFIGIFAISFRKNIASKITAISKRKTKALRPPEPNTTTDTISAWEQDMGPELNTDLSMNKVSDELSEKEFHIDNVLNDRSAIDDSSSIISNEAIISNSDNWGNTNRNDESIDVVSVMPEEQGIIVPSKTTFKSSGNIKRKL